MKWASRFKELMIKAIFFDLGDTIIKEKDLSIPLVDYSPIEKIPGIEELLKTLKSRYKMGIISNTISARAKEVWDALKELGLDGYFDLVLTSVDVGYEKPDLRIFREALSHFSVSPQEAVMIGDRIKTDILGANRVGMKTILHKWHNRYPETIASPQEEPTFRVKSLKEIPLLLETLNRRQAANPTK